MIWWENGKSRSSLCEVCICRFLFSFVYFTFLFFVMCLYIGPDGQQILRVDGPHSAPSEHYCNYGKDLCYYGAEISTVIPDMFVISARNCFMIGLFAICVSIQAPL